MVSLLKQSTGVTVQLGPFVDATDGVTAETGLSPTVEVSKAGAAFGARDSASAITHDADGWYTVPLSTTDTGTLGRLILKCTESGAAPAWAEFIVVPANIYDSWVAGTDYLQTDAVQISGTAYASSGLATAATAIGALTDAAADGDPTSADTLMQYVKQLVNVLVGTAGVATFPAEAAPGNAVSLAEVIRAIHADVTGLDGAAMRGTDSAALASTFTGITSLAQWLGAMAGKQTPDATALTEIKATGAGSGTFSAVTDSQEAVSEAAAAILVDTDELQVDWVDGGRLDLILDAILADTSVIPTPPTAEAIADAVWDEAMAGHTGTGSAAKALADILLDTGTDGVVISAATANAIADALLKRDWTLVSGEAARSVLNALRALRNKVESSAGTLTVYEEDDATPAWTALETTDAAAEPVVTVDPT